MWCSLVVARVCDPRRYSCGSLGFCLVFGWHCGSLVGWVVRFSGLVGGPGLVGCVWKGWCGLDLRLEGLGGAV